MDGIVRLPLQIRWMKVSVAMFMLLASLGTTGCGAPVVLDASVAGADPQVKVLAIQFHQASDESLARSIVLERDQIGKHQLDPIELGAGEYLVRMRGFTADGILLTQSQTAIELQPREFILIDAGGIR